MDEEKVDIIRIYEATQNGAIWTGVNIARNEHIVRTLKEYSLTHPNRTFFVAQVEKSIQYQKWHFCAIYKIVKLIAYAINGRIEIR